MTRTASAREFLRAAQGQTFLVRVCRACGATASPDVATCPACGARDAELRPATGLARLVSWSVPHSRPAADGSTATRVIAIGELAEGPWWWAYLEGVDPADLSVGMPLRVGWRSAEPGVVPVFRPATESP